MGDKSEMRNSEQGGKGDEQEEDRKRNKMMEQLG